ncbi:unnamed protein product [Rhizoctonia solani]|uniref:Uncharacterized protein n=1 Tax=Rhizoctonia solani TaxID=456999 RepID=A0A8H3HRI5_9AGAM|nr:unnamed protein product [Rhizoctonia solani]
MFRQHDFKFRLSQWLLDQLNSRGELETVTQQFTSLLSQVQEESIGDLYAHIGYLIFQKVAQIPPEALKITIQLCAELSCSLFVFHFKQHSGLSLRVTLIHEQIFRLCVDSVSAKSAIELADTRNTSEDATGYNAASPRNDSEISVEKNSELLFYLCDFRLISLAQICEYMLRVIESHKTSIGARLSDAVSGVRLLNGLFLDNSPVPWKGGVDSFSAWIDAHTSLEEVQISPGVGRTIQNEEPHVVAEVDGAAIKPRSFSTLGDHSDDHTFDSLHCHASSNGVARLGRSPVHEEVEMDELTGNNIGKHPQTPLISRTVSPVDVCLGSKGPAQSSATSRAQPPANASSLTTQPHRRASTLGPTGPPAVKQVPRGILAGTGRRPTSSVNFNSIEPAQAPEKKAEAPAAASSPPASTPTPSNQKKTNIHELFQGGGVPTVVDTTPPMASTPTQPPETAPMTPLRDPGSGFNGRNSPPFPHSPQIGWPPLSGPSTSGGQRPAESPRLSANVPLQHQHQRPMVHPHQHHNPHPGHPMQPPPQWGGGYYYPPPHDYNPYAMYWGGPLQHQQQHMPQIHQPPMQPSPRTQPAQPRPPSTPPVLNSALPHPLPRITTTAPQAPPSTVSPSSSVDAPAFVPGGLRRSVTTPVSPKRQSVVVRMETEQQKNERLDEEKVRKELQERIDKLGGGGCKTQ